MSDPATITREVKVQVERALSSDLWTTVRAELDARCNGEDLSGLTPTDEEAHQWRIARAAILLMGDSGLRRDEVANARRENLRLSPTIGYHGTGNRGDSKGAQQQRRELGDTSPRPAIWALTVIGKRRKQRTVPVSVATFDALRAHWIDRGRDFDASVKEGPLIAPIVIPGTYAARDKHDGKAHGDSELPYANDALGRLVREEMKRLAGELLQEGVLSHDAHAQLLSTSAHAFRHTFGTRVVARGMPIDVVQTILGHASLQTTTVYVRAEQTRMLEAAASYYDQKNT